MIDRRLLCFDFDVLHFRNFVMIVVLVFTALYEMQTRSIDENSVCPSAKPVHCDKAEEISVQIFIPYERAFSLVF